MARVYTAPPESHLHKQEATQMLLNKAPQHTGYWEDGAQGKSSLPEDSNILVSVSKETSAELGAKQYLKQTHGTKMNA